VAFWTAFWTLFLAGEKWGRRTVVDASDFLYHFFTGQPDAVDQR
jgi:hypothetical protein